MQIELALVVVVLASLDTTGSGRAFLSVLFSYYLRHRPEGLIAGHALAGLATGSLFGGVLRGIRAYLLYWAYKLEVRLGVKGIQILVRVTWVWCTGGGIGHVSAALVCGLLRLQSSSIEMYVASGALQDRLLGTLAVSTVLADMTHAVCSVIWPVY